MKFEDRLRKDIEEIRIIDTHEHILSEKDRLAHKTDLFYWFSHYASSDLVSAGMPSDTLSEIRDTEKPLEERWNKFFPYWECVRTTGYGKALLVAARDLFGVSDINEKTYRELSEKISAKNKQGYYKWVLKEKAGIDIAIHPERLDLFHTLERDFFLPVLHLPISAVSILISNPEDERIPNVENLYKKPLKTIESVVDLFESLIDGAIKKGAVGLKCSEAYNRTLRFDDVGVEEAKSVFEKIRSRQPVNAKPLEDYLMHRVLEMLSGRDIPIQIHTGIQEGNGNWITNSRPTHLTNLFLKYPKVKFDIFHAGYPYSSELAVLAKNFPNVYADMCWMYVISPTASKRILHEWIDTIPNNKIFGFGGDYIFVEGAYAHSRFAREIICQVLIEKWEKDYFTEEECMMLARKMLRDNPANFFKINN